MLIIRFSRVGKKNRAQYRIVLAEKTAPVKGKFVELLGSHDPHQKQSVLKEDRIKYWIGKGAQCSDSVFNLLVTKGVIEDEKRQVKMPEKEVVPGEEKKEATETIKEPTATAVDEEKKELIKEEKAEIVETPEEKKGDVDVEKKTEVEVEKTIEEKTVSKE